MALNNWTNRVITKGTDQYLSQWSFLELVGKHDKRLIVMWSYRVCNQPFDAASQTVTAQQIRLLQAKGIAKPKPRTAFLNDLIQQVRQWQQEQKEVIICMDANDPVDDPKAEISRIFRETDLTDLHHHQHPGICKPATQQMEVKQSTLLLAVHERLLPLSMPGCVHLANQP